MSGLGGPLETTKSLIQRVIWKAPYGGEVSGTHQSAPHRFVARWRIVIIITPIGTLHALSPCL